MKRSKYISCIYHTTLFFCSKRSQIKFYAWLNNDDLQLWELQQIAINHSAEIEYKGFMKIYMKYTNEPYSFLTNDTALLANNSLRFRKNLLDSL